MLTFCSVRAIDRILSGATTPGLSGPGSDDNERVFHIPQISNAVKRHIQYNCWLGYLLLCREVIVQPPQPTERSMFKDSFSSNFKKKFYSL